MEEGVCIFLRQPTRRERKSPREGRAGKSDWDLRPCPSKPHENLMGAGGRARMYKEIQNVAIINVLLAACMTCRTTCSLQTADFPKLIENTHFTS